MTANEYTVSPQMRRELRALASKLRQQVQPAHVDYISKAAASAWIVSLLDRCERSARERESREIAAQKAATDALDPYGDM